ncbi:Radical SAM superfamily protein [Planctomycetes bacterium Pla86]|uniref:Radical SAM superfamily protein n=1 Tax=Engelhardtia mirabilis TaxID=2528011 RepID=A0A518BLB9_9BACT|nr:Radical SAM superfamily protein [Planctomycetes bacterium Pla133]QDV02098.1 Radical SAM superfamily protein [Planctomycetes bacterium Pla86]
MEWLGEPPATTTRVWEERAHSILSSNDSPDVPFRWSANAYRGCAHACAYCYARPTHEFLELGAGTDFESQLVVKTNAAECLALELARLSWRGETVCLSGNTDPYQPLEASYGLTRRMLEVCLARANPVVVISKGALVRRDVDLLRRLHERAGVQVHVSIAFADAEVARAMDPGAPTPARRFETLAILSDAGVPTGVAVSPLIPGLNESDVPTILERAAAAGATRAFSTLLRLPGQVPVIFEERLRAAFPGRADHVLSALRDMRGGELHEARFGRRMSGGGARWELAQQVFELHCRRNGLELGETARPALPAEARRPHQGELFA